MLFKLWAVTYHCVPFSFIIETRKTRLDFETVVSSHIFMGLAMHCQKPAVYRVNVKRHAWWLAKICIIIIASHLQGSLARI